MRFIDLKLFLLLFAGVGGAIVYESPIRFRTLVETRDPWDVAIVGEGYFQVNDEDRGYICYTRTGKLQVDQNGRLYLLAGGKEWIVEPALCIPPDWKAIHISDDGQVSVLQPGASSGSAIGQFLLAKFQTHPTFENDFAVNLTQESPCIAIPGTVGTGIIRQGWLEQPSESTAYRYAKPIVIGIVIAVVLKLLLDSILAQQKLQKLLQTKQPSVELE